MGEPQRAQYQPLELFTARQLQEMEIPSLRFVVNDLLPEGLALLIAPPKYGKSWFSLQLCTAVARGEPFLGFPVAPGAALYLALEDSKGRLQERQEAFLHGAQAPDNLYMAISSAVIGSGLQEQLTAFIEKTPDLRLIVVDVLAKVRPAAGKATVNAYYSDYADMAPLKAIADQHHICVLVLHHYRKSQDESDFLNNASGSNGIAGSADTILGINKPTRESETATLLVTGRDVTMQSIPVMFDAASCNWRRTTAAPADVVPPIVQMILHLMEGRDEWTGSPNQMIAECAGMPFVRIVANPTSVGKSLPGLRSEITARGIDWAQKRGKERIYHFYRIGREVEHD